MTQAVDQLQETVLPYVMYKWRKRSLVTLSGTVSNSDGVQGLASVRRSEREAIKDPYEVPASFVLDNLCTSCFVACLNYFISNVSGTKSLDSALFVISDRMAALTPNICLKYQDGH